MTSTNSFFKMLSYEIKRRVPELIILFLNFGAFCIVYAVTDIEQMHRHINYLESSKQGLVNLSAAVRLWPSATTRLEMLTILCIIVCAFVFALRGFSYLFSKHKSEFYHSLPISRTKHFFVHYLSGIIVFLISCLLNILIASLMYQANGMNIFIIFGKYVSQIWIIVLYFLLFYAIALCAAMLTGNIVISMFTYVAISGLGVAIKLIINVNKNFFFITYHEKMDPKTWLDWMIAPFTNIMESATQGMRMFYNRYFESIYYIRITDLEFAFVCIILISLFTGISFLLYKKRSLENAGKAFAFKYAETAARFIVGIMAAFMLGILFYYDQKQYYWYIIGILLGVFIFSCLMNIICDFDIKKIFSHKKRCFLYC